MNDSSTGIYQIASPWSLSLSLIPIVTIFGNLLVMASVIRNRNLHSGFNYFIFGLAVVDLMIGIAKKTKTNKDEKKCFQSVCLLVCVCLYACSFVRFYLYACTSVCACVFMYAHGTCVCLCAC